MFLTVREGAGRVEFANITTTAAGMCPTSGSRSKSTLTNTTARARKARRASHKRDKVMGARPDGKGRKTARTSKTR